MYYNTSYVATLEYKRLSLPLIMLRQLHCTSLRWRVALIRPLKLTAATLMLVCYYSHATHVSEVALLAASVKIPHNVTPPLNKYSQNPCHDLSREAKRLRFSRITLVNGKAVISKYFFIDIL